MKIKLNNGMHALIDKEDFEKVNTCFWQAVKRGRDIFYAMGHERLGVCRRSSPYMHRVIMGLKLGDKRTVDHINRNGLDNRKENLRIATKQQNTMNRRANVNKPHKYKGIYFHKHARSWHSRIVFNGKTNSLGFHKTPELAAIAYNKKAKELYGEYACLNVLV